MRIIFDTLLPYGAYQETSRAVLPKYPRE